MLLIDQLKADLASIEVKHQLSFNDKTFLLAVSGGIDSMCMLDLFSRSNLPIAVAHCNFKLRGKDSDLDAQLVSDYCDRNNIPCHITVFNTEEFAAQHRISIQEAARELRYGFFDELKSSHHYDYLCTAHHGDDNIETFFMHVFRGSGLKGLTGIPTLRSDYILRPMLQLTRKEITQYVAEFQVPYREDSSNAKTKYLRNKIRHLLSPLIKSWDEIYYNNTLNSISHLTEYQIYINSKLEFFVKDYIHTIWQEINIIDHNKIDTHPEDYFLLKLYLMDLGFSPSQYNDLMDAKKSSSDHFQIISDQRVLYIDREVWYLLSAALNSQLMQKQFVALDGLGSYRLPFGDGLVISDKWPKDVQKSFVVALPKTDVVWPIVLRSWLPGDKIEIRDNRAMTKKIKKYFVDAKIPIFLKNRIWLLENNQRIESILGIRSASSMIGQIEGNRIDSSSTGDKDDRSLNQEFESRLDNQSVKNNDDFIYLIYSPAFWFAFYRPNFPQKEIPSF